MIRSHIQSQQSAATADVVTPEVVVVADVHGASVIMQRKNFTSQLSSTIAFQCFTYSFFIKTLSISTNTLMNIL